MGWSRSHHKKPFNQRLHGCAPLRVSHCRDCGNELPVTHQMTRFGNQCYPCWSVASRFFVDVLSLDAFSQTASH
jgi:hypothetical protein